MKTIFTNGNNLCMSESESALPRYMKGISTKELKYKPEEVFISIAVVNPEEETVKIKKCICDFKQSQFNEIVSSRIPLLPPNPYVYSVDFHVLKGQAIVQFSSERMDIIILIIDGPLLPEEFIESFKNFNLSKPGFIADRLKSILKSL